MIDDGVPTRARTDNDSVTQGTEICQSDSKSLATEETSSFSFPPEGLTRKSRKVDHVIGAVVNQLHNARNSTINININHY